MVLPHREKKRQFYHVFKKGRRHPPAGAIILSGPISGEIYG
jgi:hypothetical protein